MCNTILNDAFIKEALSLSSTPPTFLSSTCKKPGELDKIISGLLDILKFSHIIDSIRNNGVSFCTSWIHFSFILPDLIKEMSPSEKLCSKNGLI